jgi:hypothetical protein
MLDVGKLLFLSDLLVRIRIQNSKNEPQKKKKRDLFEELPISFCTFALIFVTPSISRQLT